MHDARDERSCAILGTITPTKLNNFSNYHYSYWCTGTGTTVDLISVPYTILLLTFTLDLDRNYMYVL